MADVEMAEDNDVMLVSVGQRKKRADPSWAGIAIKQYLKRTKSRLFLLLTFVALLVMKVPDLWLRKTEIRSSRKPATLKMSALPIYHSPQSALATSSRQLTL